jgi:hypothetical protein
MEHCWCSVQLFYGGSNRSIGYDLLINPARSRKYLRDKPPDQQIDHCTFDCVDGFHIELWKLIDSSPAAMDSYDIWTLIEESLECYIYVTYD